MARPDVTLGDAAGPHTQAILGWMKAAVVGLSDELAERVDNVVLLLRERNESDPRVYGLYTGVPLTQRGSGHVGAPDIIEIYRQPLVASFGSDEQRLAHEVRVTVLHELGHYFGLSEQRLVELGWG